MMDLTTAPRSMARLEYAAVRLPFALLDDCLIARYWDEEASLRVGFERFLGSLDEFAGLLLADDEISRRGQVLTRRTGHVRREAGPPAAANKAPAEHAASEPLATEPLATEPLATEPAASEPAAEQPDTSAASVTEASTVEVVFTLPAEVDADRVALCGDFNDWSAETIAAERGHDGTWQVTVALEPGRSYRYRYLLDGGRWENAWRADRYLPNPYGGVDSVVVVE